jgi:hypothetical protein
LAFCFDAVPADIPAHPGRCVNSGVYYGQARFLHLVDETAHAFCDGDMPRSGALRFIELEARMFSPKEEFVQCLYKSAIPQR